MPRALSVPDFLDWVKAGAPGSRAVVSRSLKDRVAAALDRGKARNPTDCFHRQAETMWGADETHDA